MNGVFFAATIFVVVSVALSTTDAFKVSSRDFGEGEPIPFANACDQYGYPGLGKSLQVSIENAPAGTQSTVLVVHDAGTGPSMGFSYTHWVVKDLPVNVTIASDASANGAVPGDILVPYVAMCPPTPQHHIYRITAFARDVAVSKLTTPANAASAQLWIQQLQNDGHTIQFTETDGVFPAYRYKASN
jgi:phosphatidylethanolamine-binding protein (PEBP) family uncharacterized protein